MWAAECSRGAAAARPPPAQRYRLQPALHGASEPLLLELAAGGAAVGAVWEPPPSLVVPGTYRRFERFAMLCERFERQGWPVRVRRSGGGLVPQGPGVVNLSLAWRTRAGMAQAMTRVYASLCHLVQDAVAPFGIALVPQGVEGSFCDGRFNLAFGGRKVAGTAQYWQRVSRTEHAVLAHACLLVDADLDALTLRANEFEAQLGSDRSYRADALANLAGADEGAAVTVASVSAALVGVVGSSDVLC